METVRFSEITVRFYSCLLERSRVHRELVNITTLIGCLLSAQRTVHFHSCVLETSRIQGESIISRLSLDAPYLLKEVCITIAV